jgi:hypothetical protein
MQIDDVLEENKQKMLEAMAKDANEAMEDWILGKRKTFLPNWMYEFVEVKVERNNDASR